MTMASLDDEMKKKESQPRAPVRIVPLSFWRPRPPCHPAVHFLLAGTRPLRAQAAGLAPVGAPSILGGPVLEMPKNGSSNIVVLNGFGGELVVEEPSIAKIVPWGSSAKPSDRAPIVDDPTWKPDQPHRSTFKVIGGTTVGMTKITATTAMFADGSAASIEAMVTGFLSPPDFTKIEGDSHAHDRSGQWDEVRKKSGQSQGPSGRPLWLR
jgi:hypothetical protein